MGWSYTENSVLIDAAVRTGGRLCLVRQEREVLVLAREEGRLEVRNNYKDNLVQYKLRRTSTQNPRGGGIPPLDLRISV